MSSPSAWAASRGRDLFYYYGRRKQIAHLYPAPTEDRIIEPFAGSAAYSLHGEAWKREVILFDISPVVASVWRFLLSASEADIRALPDLAVGESLDRHLWLSEGERNLIGLHINPGSSQPKKTATRCSRWQAGRRYILQNLPKVKHWRFFQEDYSAAARFGRACWFVDAPFRVGGAHYSCGKIDYERLACWCMEREGQLIVCEAEPATWLPFLPLGGRAVNNGGLNGAKRRCDLVYHAPSPEGYCGAVCDL